MGWSIGFDTNWNRDIGYGVPAYCDHPGCPAEINRGLAYVCGGQPYGGDHGCGLYFCQDHLRTVGKRREHAQVCDRCMKGRGSTSFTPTADHPDWINHKLTDESWQQWRDENPREVELLRTLAKKPE